MSLQALLSQLPYHLPATIKSWSTGSNFISTVPQLTSALTIYLMIIFGGRYIMSDLKPLQFKPLFMLHNALLSVGSGIVLVLMLEEIIPVIYKHGFFYSICHVNAWTPNLETYYIMNYYFKFWELFDTGFLVIKKKPLQFLHVFHHTATAALCFSQLNGRTSVSWVPITANLTVHVLMYYYYFATSAGYKIWWKKYLTTLQITQFVIDLAIVYFAAYSYFASEYFAGQLPVMGTCAGTETAAVSGCAIITSYLFLFIGFYRKTYTKIDPSAKKASIKAQ